MKPGVHVEQVLQVDRFLRCAPGPAAHSFQIVSDHGAGVVQAKQRVKGPCLEFSLPHNTAPISFGGNVCGPGEVLGQWFRVVLAFVGAKGDAF